MEELTREEKVVVAKNVRDFAKVLTDAIYLSRMLHLFSGYTEATDHWSDKLDKKVSVLDRMLTEGGEDHVPIIATIHVLEEAMYELCHTYITRLAVRMVAARLVKEVRQEVDVMHLAQVIGRADVDTPDWRPKPPVKKPKKNK